MDFIRAKASPRNTSPMHSWKNISLTKHEGPRRSEDSPDISCRSNPKKKTDTAIENSTLKVPTKGLELHVDIVNKNRSSTNSCEKAESLEMTPYFDEKSMDEQAGS